jgi:hypothetical protein
MDNKISVKPDKTRLTNLRLDIARGDIRIPIFQREFVWKSKQMLDLFDSIAKGYPIGSLLFWKPETLYATYDKIGPYLIDVKIKDLSYVLDGFQRITTLFAVLTNPKDYKIDEYSPEYKEYLMYYNLNKKEFTFSKNKKDIKSHFMPLYKIVDTYEFIDFITDIQKEVTDKNESRKLIDNAKEISKIFYDYEIPFIEIKGGDITSAVEIFARTNSTGTEISEDFMLSALSYNQDTGFLFSNKITEFLNGLNKYNFDGLKRDTILNCIANSENQIYFDVKLENLRNRIEDLANNAFIHIEKAVEFLYKRLYVIDVKLLPYPTQLIFISEYFRLNPNPTETECLKLEDWFWITTYSNYFTLYSLSQQRSAYKVFLEFSVGNHPDGIYKINRDDLFNTANFPDKLNFTSVRAKALQLFFLKSIYEGQEVQNNESLKESFVFNKKDKTPANIVLRLSSEFEKNNKKKDLKYFIEESNLNEELVHLYKSNNINEFITKREELISSKERVFVTTFLKIDYIKTNAELSKEVYGNFTLNVPNDDYIRTNEELPKEDYLMGKFMRKWGDFESLLQEITNNEDKFMPVMKVLNDLFKENRLSQNDFNGLTRLNQFRNLTVHKRTTPNTKELSDNLIQLEKYMEQLKVELNSVVKA